jgi:hypothetical protein
VIDRRIVSLALHGSRLRLLIAHTVEVEGAKCHTVSYAYRLISTEAKDAWLLRWEYFRRPPRPDYPYPLAHAHANASFADPAAEKLLRKPAAHLHVPTARVALELVLWHLIAEWEILPKTSDWRQVLLDSLAGYHERHTAP